MKNILVLGATSAIAEEVLDLFETDVKLYLTGRSKSKLEDLSVHLASKKISHECIVVDFSSLDFDPTKVFKNIRSSVDTIFSFVGTMEGDQNSIHNLEETNAINFLNPVKSVLYFLPELKAKLEAQLVFVSSVAGERGRKKNFVYGSAKGALTIFASGLRASLAGSNVHVMTVLLGLVDTPMTAGMKSPLIASRTRVAKKIHCAMKAHRDVVYIPFFWRWIMLVIRSIPERMFKKMSF